MGSIVVVALVLLFGTSSWCKNAERPSGMDSNTAGEDGGVADEVIEEVAEVEVVETVELVETVPEASSEISSEDAAPLSTSEKTPSFTFEKLVGRLHPAFVHFPLGLLVALLVLEISRQKNSWSAAGWIWGLAIASFVPAAISGFLRAQEIVDKGGEPAIGPHRNVMLMAFAILIAAATLKILTRSRESKIMQRSCVGLVALASIFAFTGAHLGGILVYGSEFFPFP